MFISVGGKKLLGSSESRYIALFAMVLILCGQPWRQTGLMSLGTWLIFLAAFYDLLKAASMRFLNRPTILLLCILMLSFFSLLASADFSYKSLVALFCFWEIPIFMQFSTQNVSKSFKEKLYYVFLGLAAYYVFLALSSISHDYMGPYGIVQLDELTLGYTNPNQTGMYLLICFFILLSAAAYFQKRWLRHLYIAAAIIIGTLIFATNSRSCVLLAAAYAFYYVFFSKKISARIIGMIAKIAFFLPIILFIFIVFFQQAAQSILVMGEEFDTGRATIFSDVFTNYDLVKFLLGDYSSHQFENLHNAYLSIFATAGFFVALLYVVFLRNKFLEIHKTAKQRHQQLAFVGLITLIVHMSVEAAFFTAGSVYAVSVMCLAWISSEKYED